MHLQEIRHMGCSDDNNTFQVALRDFARMRCVLSCNIHYTFLTPNKRDREKNPVEPIGISFERKITPWFRSHVSEYANMPGAKFITAN